MTTPDRYAVIGHPVSHSRSPAIHAAFAEQTGQSLRYDRLPCAHDAFDATLRRFADGGARGVNVTLPFKFEVFGLVARATPRAVLAGACNTVRFDADGWSGDNTDGAGLVADLVERAGEPLAGRRLLLVGAGGAAAGSLGALLACSLREVVVANRTLAKADALVASHVGVATASGVALRAAALEDCGEAFDVVVNATASSVAGAAAPVSPRVLAPGALAVDLMYGAAARPFLSWAERHGARGRDGLGMLVEQAAEAFAFFRGVRPRTGEVFDRLRSDVDAG